MAQNRWSVLSREFPPADQQPLLPFAGNNPGGPSYTFEVALVPHPNAFDDARDVFHRMTAKRE
jgi:hypothetical protein